MKGAAAPIPVLVAVAGIAAISISSVLVRQAQAEGVESEAIAFWRVAFATGFLTLGQRIFGAPRQISNWPSLPWMLLSGSFLAAHFILWMVALERLSVAVSAALLATSPIWVGLASLLIFRERIGLLAWIGATLTIVCSIGVAVTPGLPPGATRGAWLALGSAVAFSGYLLCGRHLRVRLELPTYFLGVTSSAALVLLAYALMAGIRLHGYTACGWITLVALAAIPHVLGHGALNWAARRMSAFPVAAATLAEPVFAAALAWALLREPMPWTEVPLFLGILTGVAVVFWGARRAAAT